MTLHTLPTPAPTIPGTAERIEAVRKVATELYYERDEETGENRRLHGFEGLFLSAFRIIQQAQAKMRNDARRTWGEDTQAYQALCNLSYRQEADELEAALRSFKLARDDFYNGTVETVRTLIAAE